MRVMYTILSACIWIALSFTPLFVVHAQDDPNVDTPLLSPAFNPSPSQQPNTIQVVTDDNGWDNFDLGVDFAEPHMSTNPRNPTWWFNAFNSNNSNNHHTENGLDWSSNLATFPNNSGDPVTAYDSLGNLYWMTMNGPTISGTWVIKSTNNGQTWGSPVAANAGNDKNWLAADQTTGPFANYVYGTMTNSGTGSFTRSTDQGASFTQTWSFTTQSSPGMMVAVGPNVSGGNDVSGGCVYVVTNSGPATGHTYTFYRSTNGGVSFDLMSSQSFAGYVGLFYNSRNSVEGVRTRPYPFIAADNSFGTYRGRLYLVYCTNNPAGNGNKPDLYCRYSTNQGVTWSSPIMINDDVNPEAHHQWMPAIWCDKETGRLYAKWFDSRNSPNSDSTDVYASYSDDGGVTWAPNQRLTNRMFRTSCTTCGGGGDPRYQGDYTSISSNKYGAMAVWMDYRNGNFGSFTSYFPDFAMLASVEADTLKPNDSLDVVIKVPAVKLYTQSVKFSATITPSAPVTFSFLNGRDSLTQFPDSVSLKIKLNNSPRGIYTIAITGSGPGGMPVHRRNITLRVESAFLEVYQPNGGEQMFAGTSYPISWGKIFVDSVNIEYSTDRGATWQLIAADVPARPQAPTHPKLAARRDALLLDNQTTAVFNWIVPSTPSTNCLVRVSQRNNSSVLDTSNAPFTILATPAPVWQTQSAGTATNLYSVSIIDTSTAWAAGDSGRVYRTVNGGGSWAQRATLTNPISSIVAVSPASALAASNAPGNARILRTQNSGLGWATVYQDTSGSAFINAIKMFDSNNGYAVGDPVNGKWTLLATTNGGGSWFRKDTTLLQAGQEFGWGNSMSWIGNQYGWFGTNNSRVYRTTNGGESWSAATTPFANTYAVSFSTNQLGMSGGESIARSTDGGTTWELTGANPPFAPIYSISAADLNTDRWYFTAGPQIFRTADHGASYSAEFGHTNLYQAMDMKVVTLGGNNWLTGYAVGDGGTLTKFLELLVVSGVELASNEIPATFSLSQNYPNPFNPTTTISFGVPASAPEVTLLQVFDVLGREVRTLVREKLPAGTYTAKFETAGLSSGVYFYRLTSGRFAETKKMLLAK